MAISKETWDKEATFKYLQDNVGLYFDRLLNKSTNMSKVRFYNMLSWSKVYSKMFDNAKGGFIFRSKLWTDSFLRMSTKEELVINSVMYYKIAEHYKFNYVYVIKGTHKGQSKYKIGKANDPQDRIKMFNVKIPFDIETVVTFRVKDALSLEKELHSNFSNKRLAGEWFDLDNNDLMELIDTSALRETKDYHTYLDDYAKKLKAERWKNKDDYIEYLESLLILNNVKFEGR